MKKILVVVDMQNDFVDGALGTPEAVKIVPSVVAKIKKYMDDENNVYFTRDTHEEDYLETQEGQSLPVEHCIEGTYGWQFNPEIEALIYEIDQNTRDVVFEKPGFGSMRLAETLRREFKEEKNLEIELVGLCTDICVVTNALLLKTYLPEAMISVDASCCAGVTPASHQEALNVMKMCQVNIVNEIK
ncbi:MAG: isochorismatase family cysteine hydrolase [Proteocatella sp.]